MNDKTKEKETSLVRNATVKSKEEYDEAKKRLDYYVEEYKWITEGNSEDKVKEIEDEARKIRAMIKINVDEDEKKQQEYYRRYHQILARKQKLIKSGKYEPYLKQNIITLYAAIKQFEIDSLEYTLGSLIKGALSGEKNVIDNLKTDRLLSRIRVWEGLPKEEDLLLQPAEELVQTVTKDLVNIKAPEIEEQNTLPAISEGYLSPNQTELIERVEAYIHEDETGVNIEANVKEDIKEELTGNIEIERTNTIQNRESGAQNRKKQSPDKDNRRDNSEIEN